MNKQDEINYSEHTYSKDRDKYSGVIKREKVEIKLSSHFVNQTVLNRL